MKKFLKDLGVLSLMLVWLTSGWFPIWVPVTGPTGTIQLKQVRWARVVSADTGGPNTPDLIAGVASGSCTDNMTWGTGTQTALDANDTSYITITGTAWDAGNVTDELRISDFNFSLTGTVTSIDGIEVEVLGWTPTGTPAAPYHTVSLFTAPGSNQGDNKATGNFPTADPGSTYQSFGGTSDDWLPSGSWTEAEIESANFGVALCFTSGEANATMNLDHVRITVTYTVQSVVAPTVTTNTETGVGNTGATMQGEITDTGGENATERGFAWGTSSNLSGGDTSTTTESGDFGVATFSQNVFNILSNTTYYFRAYATNSGGTGYGSIGDFTTGITTTPSRLMRLFEGFRVKLFSGRLKIFQQ